MVEWSASFLQGGDCECAKLGAFQRRSIETWSTAVAAVGMYCVIGCSSLA